MWVGKTKPVQSKSARHVSICAINARQSVLYNALAGSWRNGGGGGNIENTLNAAARTWLEKLLLLLLFKNGVHGEAVRARTFWYAMEVKQTKRKSDPHHHRRRAVDDHPIRRLLYA